MRMDTDGDGDAPEEAQGEQGQDNDDKEGNVVRFWNEGNSSEGNQELEEEQPRKSSLARQFHERLIVLEDKSFQDNIMFARQQEELDAIANERSEDRVIFTGIYIEGFYRMSNEEKIESMKGKTQKLVDKVLGEGQAKIESVNQVNRSAKAGPVTMNARFNSRDSAKSFRAKYARMMKEYNKDGTMPNDLRGINVLPSQRFSTRVRIYILIDRLVLWQ